MIVCPFSTRQVENLDEGMVEEFFMIEGTVRDVLGIELVAAALFINPIKYFIDAFLVVLVLDEMLLD